MICMLQSHKFDVLQQMKGSAYDEVPFAMTGFRRRGANSSAFPSRTKTCLSTRTQETPVIHSVMKNSCLFINRAKYQQNWLKWFRDQRPEWFGTLLWNEKWIFASKMKLVNMFPNNLMMKMRLVRDWEKKDPVIVMRTSFERLIVCAHVSFLFFLS